MFNTFILKAEIVIVVIYVIYLIITCKEHMASLTSVISEKTRAVGTSVSCSCLSQEPRWIYADLGSVQFYIDEFSSRMFLFHIQKLYTTNKSAN